MTLGDVQGKKIGIRKMFFLFWAVRLHEYFEAWKH